MHFATFLDLNKGNPLDIDFVVQENFHTATMEGRDLTPLEFPMQLSFIKFFKFLGLTDP